MHCLSPIPAEPNHESECQYVPPKFDASYDDKDTVADLIDFTTPYDVKNKNDDELVQPSSQSSVPESPSTPELFSSPVPSQAELMLYNMVKELYTRMK